MSSGVTAEPARVFMTADAVGGVWSYALELAAALSQRGIEIDLAVLGPVWASAVDKARRLPRVHVLVTGLPLDWTAASEEELRRAANNVAELARYRRAEVVHLNAPALAIARYAAPTVVVAHSCLATWWAAVRTGPLPEDFAWRTAVTARGLRAADAIVTPSASFAAATQATYGADLAITPVLNGRTPPPRARTGRRRRFAFTAGRLWDDGKNVAALDRAAADLGAPFFAAGPLTGPNGASIKLAHLRPLGSLDEAELADWYAHTPIFASAATYEPFGLTALEAAAAGAALVLSDIPTFRELWDGAAVFVAKDAEVAPVLRELLDSPATTAELGVKAATRACRYTADAMARHTLAVYRSVLTRRRAAA